MTGRLWSRLRDRAATTGGRAALRIVNRLPLPVVLNPERVAIKSAILLAGLTALFVVKPMALNALLPYWVVHLWGATWALGGLFGLVGYLRSVRRVEKAGHRLIILGAVVYATSVGVVVGRGGYVTIVLVTFLAAASLIRLLIANAARQLRRSAQQRRRDRSRGAR